MKPLGFLVAAALALPGSQVLGQQARITIDASRVQNRISPLLYGSCIEDVNHEIYGGLYDQKLFGESFEEPPLSARFRGWKTLGGVWSAQGQGAAVKAEAGAKLVSERPAFGDGLVEAEVKFPSGGENAGLLVRVGDAGPGADNFDGYEISLMPGAQKIILGKHRHNWQSLRQADVTFDPSTWTRLRVRLDGARIRVFVNEGAAPLIDFTDEDAPLLSGTFALRTWNADAAFQNVLVRSVRAFAEVPQKVALELEQAGAEVSGMWDAVRTGAAQAEFAQDAANPYNGALSQMIRHGAGAGEVGVANSGLNRWGVALRAGQKLGGRLHLRGKYLQGPVTLALQSADGRKTYATQRITGVGASWARFAISLESHSADSHARFVVTLDKPGTLWIDQAVLTGTASDQFKGLPLRADIGNALVAQGLRFLRYGGTMVNAPEYRWKKMIGDPDRRPPYRGHWYPHSTNGFGIEEFVRFCRAASIEPAFAINIEETAQDAADLVEYLNGPATSTWGRRRAQNGHTAPYNVRYIEIGNEEVIGGDVAADYDHYIERFQVLEAAIHRQDPRIQLVNAAWWRPESPSMERVFKALDGKAAFWDLHVGGDDPRTGLGVDRDLSQMQALFQKWSPNTRMKVAIFEENGGQHNQARALGHATILNAVRRHGDFVLTSCPANALQPLGQNDNGWDQGQIFFTPSQVWGMPPFYAQQMAARHHQPLLVASTSENSPDLDITATKSEDGKTLVLHVVNVGAAPISAALRLQGFSPRKPTAQVEQLAAPLGAVNTPENPAFVRPQRSEWRHQAQSGAAPYTFAAHSITILRFG